MSGGYRKNQNKNRLSLISMPALWAIGEVYTKGANSKYGPRDWEKGLLYSETLDSALRHLLRWMVCHRDDGELNTHHLANAAWNIIALLHMELLPEKYKEFDDRPDYRSAVPNDSVPAQGTGAGGDRAEAQDTITLKQFEAILSMCTSQGRIERGAVPLYVDIARRVAAGHIINHIPPKTAPRIIKGELPR